jgi:hypothetical protein
MFPQHLGDYVDVKYVHVNDVTAGGADDGVEKDGVGIDRQDFYSGVLAVPIEAVLTESATATVSVTIQESADNSSFSDIDNQPDDLVLTGGTGGSTETGILEHDLDLKALDQYVRAQITVTMSEASGDTAVYGAALALGGSVKKPV